MRIAPTFLLTFILAATAFAQGETPARFFIERIEVRNASRVSPELIISETLLRAGNEYSEGDLAAATARLNRLPFLLSADFALEKGSERGRHLLVISVAETKPLFVFVDARTVLNEDPGGSLFDPFDPATSSPNDAAIGFRWFTGSRGIVHAGLSSRNDPHGYTRNYTAPAIGYTRYDLFGTRALATVNLRWAGKLSPQLLLALPITTTQTVSALFEDTHFRDQDRHLLGQSIEVREAERRLSLSWSYNTTNQPFVPTRGTIVSISATRSMADRASAHVVSTQAAPTGVVEPYARHNDATSLDLALSRFWELSEKNAFRAAIVGGWARSEQRLNAATAPFAARSHPTYEIVRAGYSRSLWNGDRRSGDSRLEFDVHLLARQLNVKEGEEVFGVVDRESSAMQVSTSWVRRSSYGTVRLGLGYAWGE